MTAARRAAAGPIQYFQRVPRVPLPAGANAKYVGPRSRWGNPWTVGRLINGSLSVYDFEAPDVAPGDDDSGAVLSDDPRRIRGPLLTITPALSAALYRVTLEQQRGRLGGLERDLRCYLVGYNLACWCAPDRETGWPKVCEATLLRDILEELA